MSCKDAIVFIDECDESVIEGAINYNYELELCGLVHLLGAF